MTFAIWAVVLGLLLITMAMTGALAFAGQPVHALSRGGRRGPAGIALPLDPINDSTVLEHVTEAAVLISLFVTGLKLSAPLSDIRWRLAISLALGAMVLTVGAIALIGVAALGLPVGAPFSSERSSRPPIPFSPRRCRWPIRRIAIGCDSR